MMPELVAQPWWVNAMLLAPLLASLNGRSFQTLIMLTPGVVVTQTAYDDQGQFSVNPFLLPPE